MVDIIVLLRLEELFHLSKRDERLVHTEPIRLPLRWEFTAVDEASDKSIRWKWRSFTHAGEIAMVSKDSFETLTECQADARSHGYRGVER